MAHTKQAQLKKKQMTMLKLRKRRNRESERAKLNGKNNSWQRIQTRKDRDFNDATFIRAQAFQDLDIEKTSTIKRKTSMAKSIWRNGRFALENRTITATIRCSTNVMQKWKTFCSLQNQNEIKEDTETTVKID